MLLENSLGLLLVMMEKFMFVLIRSNKTNKKPKSLLSPETKIKLTDRANAYIY